MHAPSLNCIALYLWLFMVYSSLIELLWNTVAHTSMIPTHANHNCFKQIHPSTAIQWFQCNVSCYFSLKPSQVTQIKPTQEKKKHLKIIESLSAWHILGMQQLSNGNILSNAPQINIGLYVISIKVSPRHPEVSLGNKSHPKQN